MLLLFWLIIMHSISTNAKSGKTEVTAKKFFFPKLVICGAYFVQLVTMRIFVYVQFSQDPFFDALEEHHMTKTYDILHVFGIIFGSLWHHFVHVLASFWRHVGIALGVILAYV